MKLCLLVLIKRICVFDKLFYFPGFLKFFKRNAKPDSWVSLPEVLILWVWGREVKICIFSSTAEHDGANVRTPNLGKCWSRPGKPRCKTEVAAKNPKSWANRICKLHLKAKGTSSSSRSSCTPLPWVCVVGKTAQSWWHSTVSMPLTPQVDWCYSACWLLPLFTGFNDNTAGWGGEG